eukprot:TRINITY_DN6138_c0_g1_i2.p1 TRINITY_DN6138_c0_g1~~TRINITY_DN6138_c0_g1_i2.p1  ORF type:complete len:267 (-),score=76.31 TRINITY_DN6138_c0_g1_i2:187-987(-)
MCQVQQIEDVKKEISTKTKTIADLESICNKLRNDLEQKMIFLKASKDETYLRELLRPKEEGQNQLKDRQKYLEREKLIRVEEVNILKEEKKKLKKLSSQRDDLDYRVRRAEERMLQQSKEEQELTDQLWDMLRKTGESPTSRRFISFNANGGKKTQRKQNALKLNTLIEEVSELRKQCYGGNIPVELSWHDDLEAPLVYICGNFPEEDFSIPHMLTKIKREGEPSFWRLQMVLPTGTFLYKYNINGEWKVDTNALCQGDANVLVVK